MRDQLEEGAQWHVVELLTTLSPRELEQRSEVSPITRLREAERLETERPVVVRWEAQPAPGLRVAEDLAARGHRHRVVEPDVSHEHGEAVGAENRDPDGDLVLVHGPAVHEPGVERVDGEDPAPGEHHVLAESLKAHLAARRLAEDTLAEAVELVPIAPGPEAV